MTKAGATPEEQGAVVRKQHFYWASIERQFG
jgi:hypothetical protein